MKKPFLFLVLPMLTFALTSHHAVANERAEKTKLAVAHLSECGNFVRSDVSNVYSGFGSYWTGSLHNRSPMPGKLIWTPIDSRTDNLVEYQIQTLDSAIDLISYNKLSYVLTYSGIEEWDLVAQKRLNVFLSHKDDVRFGNEQHPQAFAQFKSKFIIAHGRLGVSFFDLSNKKITNTYRLITSQAPRLESTARGVAISGKYAFVVLDSYSLVGPNEAPAFRGLVVIDMESEKIIREIGELPPGLDSVSADDDVVILSFYGMPLWKYSVNSLLTTKSPQPLKRVFKFPVLGHPTGKALLDEKYYHTCYKQIPETAAQGAYYIKTKTTMNRSQLMLD